MTDFVYSNELYHHGIKGQKWGVRRYQNKDGSLTQVGRKRYSESRLSKVAKEELDHVRLSNDPAIQKSS